MATSAPRFQEALETIEELTTEDQAALIEIVRQRLVDVRRAELAKDVREARADFERGDVRLGSVEGLMKEIDA